MARPLNFAIVGTGTAAELLLAPALRAVEGAQLWSVVSRTYERAEHFAAEHGAASPTPAYQDLRSCLADPELDCVIIATPDALHADQAISAARAGKHVFVEKPLATSVEAARAVIDACTMQRVKLGVGYHHRFHAGHRVVANALSTGALGRLQHMRVQWTYRAKNNANWRAKRDLARWWALAGVGTHALDLVRWWMLPTCGEVSQVRSMISKSAWGGPNDETALLLIRFESGATAELLASVLFDSPRRIDLYGTEGSVHCEGTLGPYGEGAIVMRGEEVRWEIEGPYESELRDFVEAARGTREPAVNGEEALRNIEILEHAIGNDRT
jgi:1,5-anhydro-D-fructose reductase (1,5-anhydro-D-mannitol-forming)